MTQRLKVTSARLNLADGTTLYLEGEGVVLLSDSQTKSDPGKPLPPATRAASFTMKLDKEEFDR